ncbi:hydrogenase nickel incorporation protein HypB [Azospirillum sp. ST 5-10]|uniref:hydrogenase nickel incorporation protein HypB n=1 Tax=unclassified Azospirillum TaxID=2630922 RepID=UPI003F4A7815
MCDQCGCGADRPPDGETSSVLDSLRAANDRMAARVRAHLDARGVLAVNLMSSPGAGKTSLLEATIGALPAGVRVAVVEGDLETENDARRIRRHGVPAVQITTGVACHLDAAMVHDALAALPLDGIDLLFIENVGNLVCPAGFAVGQHRDVVLLSVTEGDDKPEKYPFVFRAADLVLITKTDLLPYVGQFDVARARAAVERVGGPAAVAALSAMSGHGLGAWIAWLLAQRDRHRAAGRRHLLGRAEEPPRTGSPATPPA